jgi:uncharacterized protein YoxC
MTLTEILTAVFLIAASALCIAIILYLGKITKSINAMQLALDDLSSKAEALFTSVSSLTEKLIVLAEDIKDQVLVTKSVVNRFKESANAILDLEEKVRAGIEEPALNLLNNLKAVSNGITTFFNYFRRKDK